MQVDLGFSFALFHQDANSQTRRAGHELDGRGVGEPQMNPVSGLHADGVLPSPITDTRDFPGGDRNRHGAPPCPLHGAGSASRGITADPAGTADPDRMMVCLAMPVTGS